MKVKLIEVFKFRHDDAAEFVTDMSLKWAEKLINQWSQSNHFAREEVKNVAASRLAEYIGAMRDAASDRTTNFPYFEIEDEMEKLEKKNPEEFKSNPYGVMFVAIINSWTEEYGFKGKMGHNDIGTLFDLVARDLEKLPMRNN